MEQVGYDGLKKTFIFDDGATFHFSHTDSHQKEVIQLLYKEGKLRIRKNAPK